MSNITPLKTEAEQALIAQGASVAADRKAAFARFADAGLPHRRVEAYHYTDLRALLKNAPPPAKTGGKVTTVSPLADIDAYKITLVDGHFDSSLSSALPQGVNLQSVSTLADDGTAQKSVLSSDPVIALNAAFSESALDIEIAAKTELAKPIFIRLVSTGVHASYPRVRISIGDHAKAFIVESHEGGVAGALVDSVLELRLGDHVEIDHLRLNLVDPAATVLTTFGGAMGKESLYRGHNFVMGGALSRHQIFFRFEGEQSKAEISSATLLNKRQHADSTLIVDHAVPDCQSREFFAHVLDDESLGVFQGKIIVRPGAQQTDGKMMSRAIVLEDGATMNNKPELEIFADDVACGHGATVGALDEDLLFYLRARGLPKTEAEALMLQAFVGEALEKIEHDGLRDTLESLAEAWLKARSA
ncbi:MAG: Fe-S cluster assembly protein SufD [Hyphomicrobiales bacterium]